MSTALRLGLGVAAIAACCFAAACSMSASAESDALGGRNGTDSNQKPNPGVEGSSSGAAPATDLGPTDNAIILVHAAKAQPFRLCFDNARSLQPQPDKESMPQANVVGVEVGSAVRIPSLPGAPGKVYLFEEPLIRALYFNPAGSQPDCETLITSAALGGLKIELGTIDKDLKTGVHLLVVKGCPKGSARTEAECGKGFSPAVGNLSVDLITLSGAYRNDPKKIPTQVVNLSQPLDIARGTRALSVSFGKLATPGKLTSVVDNPPLFTAPGAPVSVDFDPEGVGSFDDSGFRLQVPAEGPAAAIDVDYSLAQIQKASSPRDVPSSYYSTASNYVLLLLGDPNAKLEDGGPDNDPRNVLHFLAVPVVENADGGAPPDASPDAP